MVSFREKWLAAVDKKDSVLCAGLDLADFEMGRGVEGLPSGVKKRDWTLAYIEAVAPHSAALKPNFQYWKGAGDDAILREATALARSLDLTVIDDSKLADIGSTNEAGIFYAAGRGADAVTIAPYAGNMGEAAEQGRKHGVGVITMCLMSNPHFAGEKNQLVNLEEQLTDKEKFAFDGADVVNVNGVVYIKRYIHLASCARNHELAGIVIGAPSTKNHLTNGELAKARDYAGDEMLVLLPGVGKQGGEAEAIWKYFGANNVIVNVGRGLMFPDKDNSLKAQWAAKAEEYKNILNEKRNAA